MPRFFVLEDEPLIVAMLAEWLEQQNHVVAGTAQDTLEALKLVDTLDLDAAIVDIEVRDGTAYPLAKILRERRIPFAFATGWPREAIDPDFRDQMIINKPIRFETLGQTLRELLLSFPSASRRSLSIEPVSPCASRGSQ